MIVFTNKKLADMKIGFIGTKGRMLAEKSVSLGVASPVVLEDIDEVDKSFDLVFGAGLYRLIPEDVLTTPRLGMIFFHATPLPEGKGAAPTRWTIENNRPNITVTAFRPNDEVDAGPIACQVNMPISSKEVFEELEAAKWDGVINCLTILLSELEQGVLVLREQTGRESFSPRRTPRDSEVDADKTIREQWDLIRCCDNTDFPAFFMAGGRKVILRYEVADSHHYEDEGKGIQ